MRKEFEINGEVVATVEFKEGSYSLHTGTGNPIKGVRYAERLHEGGGKIGDLLRPNELLVDGMLHVVHVSVRGETLLVETTKGDTYLVNKGNISVFSDASINDIIRSSNGEHQYFVIKDHDTGRYSVSQDGKELFKSTFSEYFSTSVQLIDGSEETLLCFRTLGKEAYIVNPNEGLFKPAYNDDIQDHVRLLDVLGTIYFQDRTERPILL